MLAAQGHFEDAEAECARLLDPERNPAIDPKTGKGKGEMVVGATPDTTFVDAHPSWEVSTGSYDLEIRVATDFATLYNKYYGETERNLRALDAEEVRFLIHYGPPLAGTRASMRRP